MTGNTLYGEGFEMFESTGGNDILTSNDGNNYLVGDAQNMYGTSKGGNDMLISGRGTDTMYGDAYYMDATATGGNDILNAAKGGKNGGADMLYGDDGDISTIGNGGADRFILGANTLAVPVDYNEEEGDVIIAASNTAKTTTNTENEQQQIQGQLNNLLLQEKIQKSPTTTPG